MVEELRRYESVIMRFIILCVLFVMVLGNSAFATSCITFDRIVAECENGKCEKAFRVAHDIPHFCDSKRSIIEVGQDLLILFQENGAFERDGVYEAELSILKYSSDNGYLGSYEKLGFKSIEEARTHWEDVLLCARVRDVAWNIVYGMILFFYFLNLMH